MKYLTLSALLSGCLTCVSMYGQPTPEPVARTTVCEIVRHPERFEGKLVQVRAQVWSNYTKYWLNESLADSLQFGQGCGWLTAEFTYPTNLVGNVAFGTFTGTVLIEARFPVEKAHVQLLIKQQNDVSSRQAQIGLIRSLPMVYERSSDAAVFVPK